MLRLAAEHGIPVTPRGAGSGMTGGALPVRGGIVLSTERMQRIIDDRTRRSRRGRRAGRHQRRPAGGGRGAGAVLPARSGQPRVLLDGRQRRRERRRPARVQVRRHARLTLGLDVDADGRRDAAPRAPHAQGRHRLRPDRAVRRQRGHVRRHHRDHGAARRPARGRRDVHRGDARRGVGGARGQRDHPQGLPAARARAARQARRSITCARRRRYRFPADAGAIVLVELDGEPDGMEAAVLRVRRRVRGGGRARRDHRARRRRPRAAVEDAARSARSRCARRTRSSCREDIVVPRGSIAEMLRARRRASARATICRRRRSATRATATCTSTCCRREPPRRRRSRRASTRRWRSCSGRRSISAARCRASTASASPRRATWRGSSRPR